jgi:hypothetical protein
VTAQRGRLAGQRACCRPSASTRLPIPMKPPCAGQSQRDPAGEGPARVRAAVQLPLGYAIRELKPVGTVSAPDWTPTSSTADSIETSNGGDALKLSAKPASEASMGSAGTAKILNPSSDLREMPGGKPSAGVAATPKIAEETPSQPPKSAKRQKREKSATAPKLNAAEADASSLPATSEEPLVTGVPPIHCRAPTLGDYNAILKGSGFSRGARGPSRRSRKLALVG